MIDVIYVLAHSRSGSTLLARMLGQLEGVVSVGEVRYLWQRGMVENQPCGCGVPFDRCAFWSEVIRRAYGRPSASDAERMAASVRAADRVWRMHRLGGGSSRAPDARTSAALEVLNPLYDAIRAHTGVSVIVDSSKSPSYASLLSASPALRVRLVHLVRDCRGVAFSRLRRVARGELAARSTSVLVARTAMEWAAVNGLAERLGRSLPYTLVRYEDFVADPRGTLLRIAAACGLPEAATPFVEDAGVRLPADHTVSGNQMRFESGWIPLRPDEEWRSRLTRADAMILRVIGRPWLARYGYA